MNGVEVLELKKPCFFDRIFGRKPRVNAGREINNLVASMQLEQIGPASVEKILTDYRVRSPDVRADVLDVYAKVLSHCAFDERLSDEELANLRRLRDALGLRHDDVKAIEVNLEELYRTRLKQALSDEAVSADEEAQLGHLASDLRLSDEQVARIRRGEMESVVRQITARARQAGALSEADEAKLGDALRESQGADPKLARALGELYRARVRRAATDHRLSSFEKDSLAGLAKNLQLPDEIVERIRKEELGAVTKAVIDRMVEDRRLWPEEDDEFRRVCRDLGVSATFDDATLALLERFRLFWRIENGETPDVNVPIKLKRGEVCHFFTPMEHFEERTVTRRVRYGGPAASIRIAKGIYWRMGDIGVSRVTENVLAPLGQGTLYLTSSRLLFDGDRKSTSIPLSKVINFQLYTDGVKIEKDSGKDQVFTATTWDPELFGLLLSSALARA